MFELIKLRDGLHTLRDLETGETFHPVVGPMIEADEIHIRPLDLHRRMLADRPFIIWDVGLGAAANAVALLEALKNIQRPFQCQLVSFDCTLEPLRFALEHAEQLLYPLDWKNHLAELADKQKTQIIYPNGSALDWQLCLADFTSSCFDLDSVHSPDGIIFDPYSPTKNPAMWSLSLFIRLRKRLTKPTILTSYSRSTAVRVTLLLAGFYVGVGSATGEKEQTTLATNDPALLQNPLSEKWLDRVRMSTSARPIGSGEKGPILLQDLQKIEAHPQFIQAALRHPK